MIASPLFPFFIYFIFGHLFLPVPGISTNHQQMNPLNGKHLRVLTIEVFHFLVNNLFNTQFCLDGNYRLNTIISNSKQFSVSVMTKRNATGHVIEIDGDQIHLITTLSRMLNFR